MTKTKSRLVGLSVVAVLGFAGCKPRAFNEASSVKATIPAGERLSEKNFCAAVRGNGELIMSHMSSLGRIVDEVELIDGFAGGSSASITAFVYESMIANPAVWQCKTGRCSQAETRQRVSFLLKSTWQVMQFLSETQEAANLMALNQARIQARASGQSLTDLISSGQLLQNTPAAVQLSQSKPLRELTNPEFQFLLSPNGLDGNSKSPELRQHHLKIAKDSLQTFGKFELKTADGFFRPGLISFEALANKVGFIGDFYAGRIKNPQAMADILDNCADKHAGKRWMVFAQTNGGQCMASMKALVDDELKAPLQHSNRRIDEQIGVYMPSLAMTSIVTDKDAENSATFVKKFMDNTLTDADRAQYKVFNRMQIGYWGQNSELEMIKPTGKAIPRSDLKSQKREKLGAATWRDIISVSPAEPGISRTKLIPGTSTFSLGGWSDLHPTLVLRDIGCKNVVYVTRQGAESVFAREHVAATLGMDIGRGQDTALFDLSNKNSSFSQSLAAADMIYCTNWNQHEDPTKFNEIDTDAAGAPIFTNGATTLVKPNPANNSTVPVGCRVLK